MGDIMSEPTLDPRLRQVLLAVIAEYVETGQPVGSRSVARRHLRGLSPATIRNAMADLEEHLATASNGFLTRRIEARQIQPCRIENGCAVLRMEEIARHCLC